MHFVSLRIGGPYPSFYSNTTCYVYVRVRQSNLCAFVRGREARDGAAAGRR